MGTNMLSEELPDFYAESPNLQALILSNQKQRNSPGLIRLIPESLANLNFLTTLKFDGNNLTSTIPLVLGVIGHLKFWASPTAN